MKWAQVAEPNHVEKHGIPGGQVIGVKGPTYRKNRSAPTTIKQPIGSHKKPRHVSTWPWIAALVGTLVCGEPCRADSEPTSMQRVAEQLVRTAATSDKTTRLQVYQHMAHDTDSRMVPILKAYLGGLLELRQGRLVIYESPIEHPTIGRVYPLVDALTLSPIKNPGGSRQYARRLGASMIRAPRSDRKVIRRLIWKLCLLDSDLTIRRQAIVTAGDRADVQVIDILKDQLTSDDRVGLTTVLRESIARIELIHGDRHRKFSAVQTLGEIGSSSAGASLRKALQAAQRQGDQQLISQIQRSLVSVRRHQTFVRIFQHTFTGLSLGSILVLLALGLSIIFGLMGVINMAHGEFMMIGAFVTYMVGESFSRYLPSGLFDYYLIVAIPAAFLVAGAVGYVCELTVISRLYGRPLETLLATWGISLLLIQTVRVIFGDTIAAAPPSWLTGGWKVAHDIVLPANRLFIIALCAFCIVLVHWVVYRTKWGLILRATTQDRHTAASLGISTRWVDGFTFAFGTGLAGVTGCAVILFDKLNPGMGQSYIVDSFMVVVVGGVGNLAGAMVAGLGLGFMTKYIEPWLEAVYGKVAVLTLVVIFLQWRPSGLFPAKGRLADA